jgi:hypothetical protein
MALSHPLKDSWISKTVAIMGQGKSNSQQLNVKDRAVSANAFPQALAVHSSDNTFQPSEGTKMRSQGLL